MTLMGSIKEWRSLTNNHISTLNVCNISDIVSDCLPWIQPLVDNCGNGQYTSLVNGQFVSCGGKVTNIILNVLIRSYPSRLRASMFSTFVDVTIMSYCHLCWGGGMNRICCLYAYLSKSDNHIKTPNIGATFGGYWYKGFKSSISHWVSGLLCSHDMPCTHIADICETISKR